MKLILPLQTLLMICFSIAFLPSPGESQFYNSRSKCSLNRLTFNEQLTYFIYSVEWYGVSYQAMSNAIRKTEALYHHGYEVKQNPGLGQQSANSQTQCRNFFKSQKVCCRYEDIDAASQALLELYNLAYYKAQHPIVDYLYRIQATQATLPSYCLSQGIRLPNKDQMNLQNDQTEGPLAEYVRQVNEQILKVKEHEIQFIRQSVCLFCLGVEDMKSFLHPYRPDRIVGINIFWQRDYFTEITRNIANALLQIFQISAGIHSYIDQHLRSKVHPSSAQCQSLRGLLHDDAEMQKRKVCESYEECLRFAQQYIGMPGCPAYSMFFASVAADRPMTKVKNKLITEQNCGFRGNETYDRYESDKIPVFELKGNEYSYD